VLLCRPLQGTKKISESHGITDYSLVTLVERGHVQNIYFAFTVQMTENADKYRGADKFLARPGRKEATEDFEFHISYL
jgi:hypothetical protein